jgi:hypothetical protein
VALLFAVPAVIHVVHLVRILATRMSYPLDLEWMEGGLLYEASRIERGLPVFAAPEEGYVPFPYPIGYPLLLSAFGWVFGTSYGLGRCISIASTAAAAFFLAREVSLHFRGDRLRWLAVAFALGSLAAGYHVVDGWYDLARVDSLAFALSVGAAASVSVERLSLSRATCAGLLLAASVLTKQSAAPLALWIAAYSAFRHRERGLYLGATAAVAFGLSLGVLQLVTDGRYWFYTVTLLGGHSVELQRVQRAQQILQEFAPYGLVLPAAGALLATRRRLSPRSVLWLGLLVASWAFGVVSVGKEGGYVNNLIPAVWLVAPTAGLLLRDALGAGDETDLAWTLRWLAFGAFSLLLLQQEYPIRKYAVTRAMRQRAEALDARIARVEGTLFAPLFPHLAERHGKGAHQIHVEAHNDFAWAGLTWREPYRRYLDRLSPDVVLLEGTESTADVVRRGYVTFEHLLPRIYDTRTRIGWSVVPRFLMRKRPVRTEERVVFDFESGDLDDWDVKGPAVRVTSGSGPGQGPVHRVTGRFYLSTYHTRHGDGATGSALSPPFVLDRAMLGMYVGGGFLDETRVELLVGDDAVLTALGSQSEVLEEVAWDVSAHRGREARLRVVDGERGGWGHVMLDHVVLYEPAAPGP